MDAGEQATAVNKVGSTLDKIITGGVAVLAFLTPLFFLPITTNFYSFNKNVLLYLFVCVLLVVWTAKVWAEKKLRLVKTPLGLPILLLAMTWVMATIFASPNKVEDFLNPGATGTIVSLILLFFIITNNLTRKAKNGILCALIASAGLLSLIAVSQYLGWGARYAPVEWMKPKLWTPAETPLALTIFLGVTFPLVLLFSLKSFPKARVLGIGSGLVSILICSGLLVTVFQMLPGKEGAVIILPYSSSWAIALEAFKRNPLWGVGPSNFVSAFNRFRPIQFNRADFWDTRFALGSSYPLQILTTTGGLGLLASVWLISRVVKRLKANLKNPLPLSLLVSLLLSFFLPTYFLALFVFFILLACWAPEKGEVSWRLPPKLAFIPLALVLLLLAPLSYWAGQAYAAEVQFRHSLNALVEDRSTDVYSSQMRALKLSPQKTAFRIAHSQTNFALANSLAARESISEQDRTTISQLIQQAIREAKIATALNPTNAETWENLARLYQNLTNFAQNSSQWAIAAYQQAINTDPINPRLRLNLGGIFYNRGEYDRAISQFENAVTLKPDFANAYYNLAAAYREKEKYPEAHQAMQRVIDLVPAGSPDFQKAEKEMEELAKKLPPPAETPGSEQPTEPELEEVLTEPEALTTPILKPPIELPEEAGPETEPAPEATPTSIPTPTP